MTLMTIAYLITGLVLLVAGAEVLVRGADRPDSDRDRDRHPRLAAPASVLRRYV